MPRYHTRNIPGNFVLGRIRRHKVPHEATFLVSEHGSWEKAEAEAKKWVKRKLTELPDPLPSKDRKTKRNTSGVVGVRLANSTKKKNGNVYEDWRWVAFWPGCPNAGGVGWSVKKYGEDRAFTSAYLARKSESTDREAVERQFLRLKNSDKYEQILALKRISAP